MNAWDTIEWLWFQGVGSLFGDGLADWVGPYPDTMDLLTSLVSIGFPPSLALTLWFGRTMYRNMIERITQIAEIQADLVPRLTKVEAKVDIYIPQVDKRLDDLNASQAEILRLLRESRSGVVG